MAQKREITIKQFTFIGFLIGFLFTFIVWLISLIKINEFLTLSALYYLHKQYPSLYVIDLLPIVFAFIFYIFFNLNRKLKEDLQKQIEELNQIIKRNSEFARKIGQGDLSATFTEEPTDQLGRSLLLMRDNLIATYQREKEQNWITKGKEIIGDTLRYHNDIEQLTYEVLITIVNYIDAIQGAFYIYNEEEKVLENQATYAYNRKKYLKQKFKIGQGLIGAAAYEKDIIYRKDIPEEYFIISSGLIGEKEPKTILISPLIANEEIQGVIEFAFLYEDLPERIINIIKEVSGIIAQTIFNLKVNKRTEKLLQEARQMTYELQKREEELKKNAELMKKTQKELEETNRKLAAQIAEVERARKRLYTLLENASEVISIYNKNGLITYESPSIKHIMGYNPEELIGKNGFEVFDPITNQKFKEAFKQLLENPAEPITFEYRFLKNNEFIWLETIGRNLLNNPAINGILFNTRDITVRKIAEKAQKRSGQMQALSENSPDMIIRISIDGTIYYANPIAQEFTGLGLKQLINKNINEIQLQDKIKSVFIETLEKIKNEPIKIEIETTFPLQNEQGERIILFNAIPEFNELNELETVLFVAHDITEQKRILQELEKKNQNITESINYAHRIQKAILPTENKIREIIPKAFLFYLPRDVVSGDIPWIYKKNQNNIYIAAIDCTGHGVPGALLSFIGYFLLNNIVSVNDNLNAAEILTKLHIQVRETLNQQSPDAEARDGMDIAFCKINLKEKKMHFAGAHRPLYMLKNNGDFIQYKGSLKAIGGIPPKNKIEKPFKNHIINFEKGDKFFIFSDGLADQIGGPKRQKYKNKRIRELINNNNNADIFKFKKIFEQDFFNWKGNNKQIDDVLLIGFEL